MTRLIVLDAADLEPVCAFAEQQYPEQPCGSVWSVSVEDKSREVLVTAEGYQSRTVLVSPVRFTTCGETGGCNLVFMVKL